MDLERMKNVSVQLSQSEFYKLALKYNVISELYTCNLKIDRSDIEKAKVESKSKSNEMETNLTITLTRSNFTVQCSQQEIETTQSKLRYELRKRKLAPQNIVPPAKRARTEIARRMPLPKLIVAQSDSLVEGLVVVAKMKSYAAWPARIVSFRKTCVTVHFFGDDTSGNVPYNGIGLFEANSELLKWNLMKKINGYRKAVLNLETILNVPAHLSILNHEE